MTRKLIVACLMSGILVIGVSGCADKYHSSQIDLVPAYVSKQTVNWCVANKCPEGVKQDLADCQANAVKQDFRNNIDEPIIRESIGDKILSFVWTAWNAF